MKKIFKWTGIVFGSLIVLIIAALILVPIIFKDDIKASIDNELKKNVDAQIIIDIDKFGISAFTHFPNITVSLEDFGVVGNDIFTKDTLVYAERFELTFDIMSIIGGEEIKLNSILLDKPSIYARVAANGKANWDIVIPQEEQVEEDTTTSKPINLDIDEWIINDGSIIYNDQSSDIFAEIKGLNHSGSGNISEKYILETKTGIDAITFEMGGVPYLNQYNVDSKLDATIDLEKNHFHLDENYIKLNEFQFNFDGDITMIDSLTTNFDMSFGTEKTEFKDVISLIPAIYLSEDFDQLKTDGSFKFLGFVQGDLSDIVIPRVELQLLVEDGFIQYPDLPEAISDINMNFLVKSLDGQAEKTRINLQNLSMKMGKNPFELRFMLMDLIDFQFDSKLKTKLDLANISSFYPIEGLTLKGIFDAHVNAFGKIDTTFQTYPTVKGHFNLIDGFVKSGEYPAIEDIQLASNFTASDDLSNSSAAIEKLNFLLDGDQFNTSMSFQNFEDVAYDIQANGSIDLEKITNVYPLEGMTLKGLINIDDFQTKGKQSDILNENFMALESRGHGSVKDFYYNDTYGYVLEGFWIDKTDFDFSPEKITVENFEGKLSKSDLKAHGHIGNYMGFIFSETDTILNGYFNVHTNTFDVDEWMVVEEGTEETTSDPIEEEYELVPIPKFIDFAADATASTILYDSIQITNAKASMTIKDGICTISDGYCNMLGGEVTAGGKYDTKDVTKPMVAFDGDIKNMEIKEAYDYFNVVKKYAPAASKMDGHFNATMDMSTQIGNDYFPIYNTTNSSGVITLLGTTFKAGETKMIKAISDVSKFNMGDLNLSNKKIEYTIVDGRLKVKPFNVKKGQSNFIFDLSKGIDGSILHNINLEAPANLLGGVMNTAGADKLNLKFLVTGNESDPKVKMDGGQSIKDNVNQVIDDKKQEQIDKILAEAEANAAKIRAEGKTRADQVRAEGKKNADKVRDESNKLADRLRKEGYDEARKIENSAKNPLERKAKKLAAEKIRSETDKKVQKTRDEGEKKARDVENSANKNADKIENEANKRADKVIQDAQTRAGKL